MVVREHNVRLGGPGGVSLLVRHSPESDTLDHFFVNQSTLPEMPAL